MNNDDYKKNSRDSFSLKAIGIIDIYIVLWSREHGGILQYDLYQLRVQRQELMF